ncbi:MAG: transcription termination/antitermination protein NusG [Legionella sp.]|nr:transcription termination/antitermination protein NusG [Legionella sp.]
MTVEEQKVKQWYVVHAYSGYENFVMREINSRTEFNHFESKIGEVVVPAEEVVEIRAGQKRKSTRKFFPGYVLVNMVMDDETWHMIRAIPRVLGFIGGTGQTPLPISEKEANEIMQRMEEGVTKPRPKILFEPGEVIRVTEGPFVDFNGVVEEVNYEKSRLRVSVLIFGRSTPVELEFSQVEKT